MEQDDDVMAALCIIFEGKIEFEDAEQNTVWSVKNILNNIDVHIEIRFRYDGNIPRAYRFDQQEENDEFAPKLLGQNRKFIQPKFIQPKPIWRPRERRGDPSSYSEAFLEALRKPQIDEEGKKIMTIGEELTSTLSQAYKKIDSDPDGASEDVYKAFKTAFGMLLSKTQKNCFVGWMKGQAQQEITKAQWLAVLKESNALWHAVVLEFRRMYEALTPTGKFQEIEVSERGQYPDGTSIPTHHISDLRIWCSWADMGAGKDVARGRWGKFVRKEFAENTEHFVREYQTLLMERFNTTQQKLYGFWFYPSDLCDWVRDLQAKASLKNTPVEAALDGNARKPFRWPASCKKGNNLVDSDSLTSVAYKAFCRQNGLWSDNRNSRLQFCQRMRAAWLRVVGAYEFDKDKQAPSVDDVIAYLGKQHIYEVQVHKDQNGRMQTVYTDKYEILSHPENYTRKQLRDSMPDHRVLVYGAPMRCAGAAANPYLCASSLQ